MLAKWNADVEKNHASSDDPTNIWEKNSADSMRSNVTKVTTMTKGTTQSGALMNNLNNNLANKAVNESQAYTIEELIKRVRRIERLTEKMSENGVPV